MQRRIEGTYESSQEVLTAVERLLNEGYKGEEIVVITDTNSQHQKELENMSLIEVDAVNPNEGLSFWEKAKEMLSFGSYHVDDANGPLSEYRIDEKEAQTHYDALRNGEILILVNKEVPKNVGNAVQDKESNQILNDSSHSEESIEQSREEMKEKYEPSPGEEEVFDPSKAQSSREDKSFDMESEKNKDEETDAMGDNENKNRLDDNDAPQITGDESSVTLDEGSHEYPDKINTGFTEGSSDKPTESPLNAEEKKEKSPSENTEQPESDAYYNDEYQDAGGKTIEDDERK